MNKEALADLVKIEIAKYFALVLGENRIVCPYYTNHVGKIFMDAMWDGGLEEDKMRGVMSNFNGQKYPYGWWRGKGKPDQIVKAAYDIAFLEGLNLGRSHPDAIREFMLMHGLGIDCSGFVYNILTAADINLDEILHFEDPEKRGVFKAGAFTFAGKASELVEVSALSDLDLILIKNWQGKYSHVALILKNGKELEIYQSTSTIYPAGVRVDKLSIDKSGPRFEFKPELGTDWGELWLEKRLEFRRLRLTSYNI